MNDAVMAIAVTEARSACKGEADVTERLRKAMRTCRDHWMLTGEGHQINAALAAAMLESSAAEKDRIARSGKAFNRLNNMMAALHSGVPVNVEAVAAEAADDGDDLIPVFNLWNECKAA